MSVLRPADWGQILQEPNLRSGDGGVLARRTMWDERATAMNTASKTAMDQLAAALMAEREKKLADMAAADALAASRGGSGGGSGGGGGGGKAPPMLLAPQPIDQAPWYDQVSQSYGPSAPPPQYDATLAPSTIYGPNAVYAAPPKPNFGIGVGRQGRGFKPPKVTIPKPTRYTTRRS